MRRLVLMADYTADPLWDDKSGSMVELSGLPISGPLRQRLTAWRERWEELAEADWYRDEDEAEEPALSAHRSEEHELWMALREELGGRFEVGIPARPPGTDTRLHVVWSPGAEPELAGWFKRSK